MHRHPDLRERYPEIERPLRLDGRPNSVKKCLEPVIKNIDIIIELVDDIAFWKELEYVNVFLFQSRAMGTCKKTSDIDIYIHLNEKHRELVKTNGTKFADTGITILSGAWARKFFSDMPSMYLHELKELHIDIFWGIEPEPPAKDWYAETKYYIELKELKQLGDAL